MREFEYVTDGGDCGSVCESELKTPTTLDEWARCKDHDSWWRVTTHPDSQELMWVRVANPPTRITA